jgi:hypothetical protein
MRVTSRLQAVGGQPDFGRGNPSAERDLGLNNSKWWVLRQRKCVEHFFELEVDGAALDNELLTRR